MENEENTFLISTNIPNTDNNKVAFVPAEDLQIINRALENWETVKKKWDKLMSGKLCEMIL